jgi:hypothetical protein
LGAAFVGAIILATSAGCGDEQAARSSSEAVLGADLPIAPLSRNEEIYQTVDELAASSSDVVVGPVASVESLGTPDTADDPNASEYFLVTVKPDSVIKTSGKTETIAFIWEGFISESGDRAARVIQDGVSMPDVGDRLLLFLRPENPDRAALFENRAALQVNTLDGILYVDNGKLTTQLHGEGRPAHTLVGQDVNAVSDALPR